MDVSAVVCTWRCAEIIEDCLRSLKDNRVAEIILVDAGSDDGTCEIAKPYVDFILSDPREGLATARNIGIKAAKSTYVLNIGADNVLPSGSLEVMLETLTMGSYTGVSAVTELRPPLKNYIAWAMNRYKLARFYPGERGVVGTPSLFPRHVLEENLFDSKMSWSDDSDLCTRLAAKGAKFAIAPTKVFEIGNESMKSVIYRWRHYGKSDWETYTKYSKKWGPPRKFRSITHPLRQELLYPLRRIPFPAKLGMIPFLI